MEKFISDAINSGHFTPRDSSITLRLAGWDHDPGKNRHTFGERHADEHERQDFSGESGIAAHGDDAASRRNTDADGRATEGQPDVNISVSFCEHHILSFVLVLVVATVFNRGCKFNF